MSHTYAQSSTKLELVPTGSAFIARSSIRGGYSQVVYGCFTSSPGTTYICGLRAFYFLARDHILSEGELPEWFTGVLLPCQGQLII